jgi:hypothetical protein
MSGTKPLTWIFCKGAMGWGDPGPGNFWIAGIRPPRLAKGHMRWGEFLTDYPGLAK